MCGRYTLKTPPDQWGQFLLPIMEASSSDSWKSGEWKPRYNIAPTQDVIAVARPAEGAPSMDYFRWGLVPTWAKELSVGNRMINARSETVHEKRSFSGPFQKQRCLVIADGYYEWQKLKSGEKQACWIAPAGDEVLCLAGLWESNRRAVGEEVRSCTILTTAANDQLAEIHDRMPVVLSKQAAEMWLDPNSPAEDLRQLMGAAEDGFFQVRKVGRFVNNARNEGEECLERVDEEAKDEDE
ncbi:MAG: SOS response-associated peptidase [Planctomycetota bacterium]